VFYISIEDSDACLSDFKDLSGNHFDFYSLDELGLEEKITYILKVKLRILTSKRISY